MRKDGCLVRWPVMLTSSSPDMWPVAHQTIEQHVTLTGSMVGLPALHFLLAK